MCVGSSGDVFQCSVCVNNQWDICSQIEVRNAAHLYTSPSPLRVTSVESPSQLATIVRDFRLFRHIRLRSPEVRHASLNACANHRGLPVSRVRITTEQPGNYRTRCATVACEHASTFVLLHYPGLLFREPSRACESCLAFFPR